MIVPSEKCTCGHDDFDHLDMGMCQIPRCKCEEFEWREEADEEDFSGASYLEGTNNER